MKHGSLFSGIGGFDLAAQWMGWENVFHCEWNDFPRKVLEYYWPEADSLTDITKTDFKKYENKISILTGGFPCQPFSQCGKRKGKDDERYLWHEMLRAIAEIKPRWVVAENVFGIINIDGGLVFQQVHTDLEAQGYEVQTFVLPAAGQDAPHQRYRCFFIAHNQSYGWIKHRPRSGKWAKHFKERFEVWSEFAATSPGKIAPNPNSNGTTICQPQNKTNKSGKYAQHDPKQVAFNTDCKSTELPQHKLEKNVTNTQCHGWNPGEYESQNIKESQQEKRRKKQLGGTDRSRSWWRQFPIEQPICSGNDGLSTRLAGITFRKWREEAVKAYGNAVVPQIAKVIFEIIEKLER